MLVRVSANVKQSFAFICEFLLLVGFWSFFGHVLVMFLGAMTNRKRSVAARFGVFWSFGHYFY